jgi:hypothetical protein
MVILQCLTQETDAVFEMVRHRQCHARIRQDHAMICLTVFFYGCVKKNVCDDDPTKIEAFRHPETCHLIEL